MTSIKLDWKVFIQLLSQDDVSKVMKYIESTPSLPIQRFGNRLLNYLLDRNAETEATRVWKLLNIDPLKVESEDWGVLSIRYLLLEEKTGIDNALSVFKVLFAKHQTRKRHLLLIIEKLIQTKQYELINKVYFQYWIRGKYTVEGKDLDLFLNITSVAHRTELLQTLTRLPLKASNHDYFDLFRPPVCPDGGQLCLIPFTPTEQQHLLQLVQTVLIDAKSSIKNDQHAKRRRVEDKEEQDVVEVESKINPMYVLDGANILYYGERKITLQGYKRIEAVINTLLRHNSGDKIQLILHARHFKTKKDWKLHDQNEMNLLIKKWRSMIDVYETGYGQNDDWFAIRSALQHNSYIITNDKFRDHIYALAPYNNRFNLDLFAQWTKEYVLNYTVGREKNPTQASIFQIAMWTERIQESEHSFYIPCTFGDGDWWIQVSKTII
jgi:hypothetical protein